VDENQRYCCRPFIPGGGICLLVNDVPGEAAARQVDADLWRRDEKRQNDAAVIAAEW